MVYLNIAQKDIVNEKSLAYLKIYSLDHRKCFPYKVY